MHDVLFIYARMSEGGTATVRTLEQVESLKSWFESKK